MTGKRAPVTTRVGKYAVPVKGIHPTLVFFVAGARGKQERGVYAFWTAVLKRPYVNRERTCVARARILLPPGERFERMRRERRTARSAVARGVYAFWWEQAFRQGEGIAYIRPSSLREVQRWSQTHAPDMTHAVRLQIGPPRPAITAPTPSPPPPADTGLPVVRPDFLQRVRNRVASFLGWA